MKQRLTPPFYVGIVFLWCAFLALLLPDSIGGWKWVGVTGSVVLACGTFGITALAARSSRRRRRENP